MQSRARTQLLLFTRAMMKWRYTST